ncbi:MAG TPA: methyltransferase [Bacteroidales bacterium]|nr:methyltransferase [Bacteroidales bacterium]
MIRQDKTAMKVGTDGVLLGAWAEASNPGRILDIGTGTGLIALMMAQRCPGALIDAVEIDADAATQAKENGCDSLWHDRLNIFHRDFFEFAESHEGTYDLVVSNPPYFNRSLKAPAKQRTMARHDDSLPKDRLIRHAASVMKPDGILALVVPFQSVEECIVISGHHLLYPQKILHIRPVPDKPYIRSLVSFAFSQVTVDEQELIVESGGRHVYSDAYKKLTKDFYLAF